MLLAAAGAPWGPGMIVLLFVLGIGLMLFELTIPGGIVGLLGACCTIAAIYLGFTEQGPILGWSLTGVAVVVVPLGVIMTLSKSTLRDQQSVDDGYTSADTSLAELVGQRGESLTTLRPAGSAMLGGRKVDVVSASEFISKGAPIVVVQVEGSRVVVRPDV